jgi:hypothetical protein
MTEDCALGEGGSEERGRGSCWGVGAGLRYDIGSCGESVIDQLRAFMESLPFQTDRDSRARVAYMMVDLRTEECRRCRVVRGFFVVM